MTSWQRRARLGVLLFGITSGAVVYFGLRQRQPVATYGQTPPLEPRAVSQGLDGTLQQVSGVRKAFDLTFSKSVTYEDGSTKLFDVRIAATNRDGREVFVTAQQAQAKANNTSYELGGGVTLRDSTGFELATPAAEYDGANMIVRATGPVTFSKGKMHGSGVGMSYDLAGDVLRVDDQARIGVTGSDAASSMSSRAGSAVLDRRQDLLTLDREVHAVRGTQVTDADRATAHLSPEEDVITFVELRGHSRVEGDSGPLQSMRARDIDLDYTDDGARLERAVLTGESAVVLRGQGSAGRGVAAERLDAALAADGTVTRLVGAGSVVMSLPADGDAPSRSISADEIVSAGGAGGTLTNARFSGHVVFKEEASESARARVARSRVLTLEMSDEAISSAVFTGAATFEEDDLRAAAAEARYQPRVGRLALAGSEAGTFPNVADRQLRVEAQAIDVGLEKRTLDATGRVKTLLNPQAKAQAPGPGRQTAGQPARLPGLFDQDQAVNVSSARLVHEGENGMARYSGSVWLWQGEKEIHADAIDINQSTGDLLAAGAARSILVFDTGRSDGQAPEIRYVDAMGLITYGPATGSRPPYPPAAHLRGSQGDLTAARIEVLLSERQVDRIEGYEAVTAQVDGKTIKGHRFTYRAKGDRYQVVGTPAAPMTVRTESCQETVGTTLTFDRSTDTMDVDGRSTRTQNKNPCRAPSR